MLIWVLQSSHCFKLRLAQHCGRRGANISENEGVRSECKKFEENSRQMAPVSTICDEYCRCTKSTKLVNFQFRFLHRILPTNLFLTKIDIKQDPNCSFCTIHPENLIHLFWNCTIVATFWENLTEKLKQINLITIDYPKYTAVYLGLKP